MFLKEEMKEAWAIVDNASISLYCTFEGSSGSTSVFLFYCFHREEQQIFRKIGRLGKALLLKDDLFLEIHCYEINSFLRSYIKNKVK